MEKLFDRIRDSLATQPHGCGFAVILSAGMCSMIGLILGTIGNFQTFMGLPSWAISAIGIAAMTGGSLIAFRWQYDAFSHKIADLQEKLTELEFFKANVPQLAIEFADNDDAFIEDGNFVVRVKNAASAATARNVVVRIHAIEPFGTVTEQIRDDCKRQSGTQLHRLLAVMNDNGLIEESVNIHGGCFEKYPVAMGGSFQGNIVLGHYNHGNRIILKGGPYRITLRVSADDCPVQEMAFAIGINGKDEVIFETDKASARIA